MKVSTKRFLILLSSGLMFLCANQSQGQEGRFTTRATGVRFDANLDQSISTTEGESIHVASDAKNGWSLGFEYAMTPRLGIELEYLDANPAVTLDVRDFTNTYDVSAQSPLRTRMIAAGLNLHLTSGRFVDVYLSPSVASLSFSDLAFTATGPDGEVQTLAVQVHNDVAWGIGLGIDVPIGHTAWVVSTEVRYLDSQLEVDAGENSGGIEVLQLNPLIVSLGVGYRF